MAEEKPFFDIPQQIEKNQIQEYLKKTFKNIKLYMEMI